MKRDEDAGDSYQILAVALCDASCRVMLYFLL